MGFGHADLVIAVPVGWVDVMSLDDLDAVAAEFRARHGHRLRIATKYHRLVREFLRDAGVADYRLVDSQGATEATVAHGTAEAVADITSTGETLRANHLKVLPDALILRSEATLWRSRRAEVDDAEMAALAERVAADARRLIRARRSRPARTASTAARRPPPRGPVSDRAARPPGRGTASPGTGGAGWR
jgi:ATP phosphoribosyltransferase